MRPTCFVLAGPNGVGKSTAAFELIPAGLEQINPDDIARQFRAMSSLQEVVLQQTNEEARRRMDTRMAAGESFSIETNLYDEQTWRYFLALQTGGYALEVMFLCVSHLNTLTNRVRDRHRQGGHFVRADVIRGRYETGLYWLNRFFDQPDALTLVDTSDGLRPVYRRLGGVEQYRANPLPDWVLQHLGVHLGISVAETGSSVRSAASLAEVRAIYDRLKRGSSEG